MQHSLKLLVSKNLSLTLGPSGPGVPRLPLVPGNPLGPGSPLSPGVPRSPYENDGYKHWDISYVH